MGASGNRRSIKLSNLSGTPAEENKKPDAMSSQSDNFEEATMAEAVEEVLAEAPVAEAPQEAPAEEPLSESDTMAAAFAEAFEGSVAEPHAEETPEAEEPAMPAEEPAAEEKPEEAEAALAAKAVIAAEVAAQNAVHEAALTAEEEEKAIDEIVDRSDSVAEALHKIEKREEKKKEEVEEILYSQISDEVGYIAKGTKIHGDIVGDGHLEINGVVEGGIIARGNVKVNGDVFGDISCGNLIINEGVLKVDVQAREDISLGKDARIEGDIRCRRISIEGTVVGNVTATELVRVSETATINGNITTGSIAVGMGAVLNGSIKMVN